MPTSEFPLFLPGQEQWLLKNYPREVLKAKSYEELLALLPYPEREFCHIMAAFVIELISISVTDIDADSDKMYDIYGTIHLVDGEGATFVLYDRQHDNSEIISNRGYLSITLPMDRAITATRLAKLHIDLKDSNQNGGEIVRGVFDWDCTIGAGYDGVHHTESFDGEGGSIVVDFVSYRHALVSVVDVRFLKDCNGFNVYAGEIVAYSGGKFSTVLFDRKPNDSVNLNSGTDIPLSRRVVIAPAVSPAFNIHVNLFNGHNHEKIVEETIQFGLWITCGLHTIDGPSRLIEAQVEWNHPSIQPHLFLEDRPPVINNDSMFPYGPKLLEIYSVSIAGNIAEDMDIWGSIKYGTFGDKISLFNEDKSSPQKLLPGQTVPLLSSTSFLVVFAFSMDLELRDGSDRSISMGNIVWDERAYVNYSDLLDRQLCSVVRSINRCYAAVHYSLFCDGVKAMVNIYLNDKNLDLKYFKVNGSVCAQYSGYDYSTAYQKEYYRKKLFVRKSSEPFLPYPISSLLLSESSVMVPQGCALMVDVNLDVTSSLALPTLGVAGNSGRHSSFVELVEFNSDDFSHREIVQKEIDGSSLQIVIQVEWRRRGHPHFSE